MTQKRPEDEDEEKKLCVPEVRYAPGALDAIPESEREAVMAEVEKLFSSTDKLLFGTGPVAEIEIKGKKFLTMPSRDFQRVVRKANELGAGGKKISGVEHGLDGQPDITFLFEPSGQGPEPLPQQS